ncbi:MAG: peptidylprolyl isomerase, partial [Bryobacteraceae bacterium]
REVRAKLIYLPFSSQTSGSEAESKAKAEMIVRQARAGADFVKLVKEHSKDAASSAQNGDIGMAIRTTTTQIPEPMRKAVLALKANEVSEPLRHENGYYVFRADTSGVLPYEQVKDEIYKELKDIGFKQWQEKTKAESAVKFENESFFANVSKVK